MPLTTTGMLRAMTNRIRRRMSSDQTDTENHRQESLETLEHCDRWLWQLYKNWNLSPPEYTAATDDLRRRRRGGSGV